MSFAQFNLNQHIFKAIEACGYTIPTPIQIQSIPDIMLGHDLVASAPTGTGKTAAFVLPALHRITLSKGTKKPRILILTPTRELASQITQGATKYGKFLNFNIISLVGGMPYRQQLRELSGQVDVVVATPGRLLDHMDNKRLDLSAIEMLILDEADRMLDMGFIDDVKAIANATPKSRQTLLFSATVDDKLSNIIRQLLKDPKRIEFSAEKLAPSLIKQEIYIADNSQHKGRLLQHFLKNENIFKGIIFSATKIHCDQLANELRHQGYEAAALHGDLKQTMRNKTVQQLRRGNIQFLVATDVAARGIDISDVTHVINYDLPKFAEDYVHRIGRTGRAGKTGIAISFILPSDARHLQKIERYIGQQLESCVVEGLEPTKRLQKNSSAKPAGNGKRFGKKDGRSSDRFERSYSKGGPRRDDRAAAPYAKSNPNKSHGRFEKSGDDFAPRRAKSSDDFAPRRPRSTDDSAPRRPRSTDDFAPRRAKSSDDFAPRRPRSTDDFAPRRPKSADGFAPRRPRSTDDSAPRRPRSTDDFAPRRAKSSDDFAPRRPRSTDDFAPRRPKSADGFAPRRPKSTDDFAPRRPRSTDDFAPRRPKSADGFAPRRPKSTDDFAPRRATSDKFQPKTGEKSSADARISYGKTRGGQRDRAEQSPRGGFAKPVGGRQRFRDADQDKAKRQ